MIIFDAQSEVFRGPRLQAPRAKGLINDKLAHQPTKCATDLPRGPPWKPDILTPAILAIDGERHFPDPVYTRVYGRCVFGLHLRASASHAPYASSMLLICCCLLVGTASGQANIWNSASYFTAFPNARTLFASAVRIS